MAVNPPELPEVSVFLGGNLLPEVSVFLGGKYTPRR
jgi:hypothetical protein